MPYWYRVEAEEFWRAVVQIRQKVRWYFLTKLISSYLEKRQQKVKELEKNEDAFSVKLFIHNYKNYRSV